MVGRISTEKVIEALLDISFIKSTGQTSLQDIAEKLSIKKSSLYNHIESRDDLIKKTTDYCSKIFKKLTFVPTDINSVAQKYTPEVVLKGLTNRYFKVLEKEPMIQIYTFVHSQKYFSEEAALIVQEHHEKIIKQTTSILQAMETLNKLNFKSQPAYNYALWFCSGINELLSIYLLKRKNIIMNNPKQGKGELFTIDDNAEDMEKINQFVDAYVKNIR